MVTYHSVSKRISSTSSVSNPVSLLERTRYRYSAVVTRTCDDECQHPSKLFLEGKTDMRILMLEICGQLRDAISLELSDRQHVYKTRETVEFVIEHIRWLN